MVMARPRADQGGIECDMNRQHKHETDRKGERET